jgi:large subunit ribosomal protein L25
MTMQMERMTLTGETRPTGVKRASNKTRRLGRIPGVVYGPGVDSFALSVDPKELEGALLTSFGRNNVFNIAFDGATHSVMVKDTQFDPVRREMTHVDFYVVQPEQEIVIDVPVETQGRSAGERLGGLLQIVSRTVRVRCQVKDIPATVPHDVTDVGLAEQVYVDEMTAPDGCSIEFKNRFPVIRVATRRGAKKAADAEGK